MQKILIVDDSTSARMYIRNLLRNDDFEIIEASNGLEALKLFPESNPDLIITDIIMPEMEGLEFIQAVKKQNHTTPIVAMTGTKNSMYLAMARRFGAVSGLQKPFSRDELIRHIYDALT